MFKIGTTLESAICVERDLTLGNLRRASRDYCPSNKAGLSVEISLEDLDLALGLPGIILAGAAKRIREQYPQSLGVVEKFVIYVREPMDNSSAEMVNVVLRSKTDPSITMEAIRIRPGYFEDPRLLSEARWFALGDIDTGSITYYCEESVEEVPGGIS